MSEAQSGASVAELFTIMRRLLAPDGCPWDRAQSPETLRPFVIEEAFEVVEAIDAGSEPQLREELGDLLLQIVFLTEMSASFGPDDVVRGICDKMIRRHPHVFGDGDASTPAEVLESWEAIKAREQGKRDRGALDGVPVALPALARAVALGKKARKINLDWEDARGVRAKIDEELAELDAAPDPAAEAEELGDLLFAIASWARHRGHDPEAALRGTLNRFTGRVGEMERAARADGVALSELSPEEIDARFVAAKRAQTPE